MRHRELDAPYGLPSVDRGPPMIRGILGSLRLITRWCVFGTHPTGDAGLAYPRGMPNYRRFHVPGATLFFTVVTHQRRRFLADELARGCLREAFHSVRQRYSFAMPAVVLLPDHLHAVWVLPRRDDGYSLRWRLIKDEFTGRYLARGGKEGPRSASRQDRKERGVWQRRFWEHTIFDDIDFERHVDYIHYNPVKHGLASGPAEWPFSSFRRWVRNDTYPPDWGSPGQGPISFADLDETAME